MRGNNNFATETPKQKRAANKKQRKKTQHKTQSFENDDVD